VSRVIRISSRRSAAFTGAILLSALVLSTVLLLAHPFSAYGITVAPGSLPSWNPAVHCGAILTSIEGVIGNQMNANGGATYGGGGFQPGIPDKRSTSPPCTVNGNATFVEIHGVHIPTYIIEDCASYPNGSFCDTTFNAVDPKCTSSDVYLCRIHMEIDQAWKSAGVAPQNPPTTTQLFDVQGFVYWDTGRDVYQWHSYSGWEIHALTAWRLSNGTKPDFALTPTPQSMTVVQGSSSTATITVNSLDNFTGTVSLSTIVAANIANTTTASVNPASLSVAAGNSASSLLTVQASQSTPTGTYSVTVKGTSGTLVHLLSVTFVITAPPPDFGISASPTSMSLALSSSGTATITLQSLYSFNATVGLTSSVAPVDTTSSLSPNDPSASFSPASITLTPNGAGSSTLTVSTSLLTLPGTYTVTITASSGTISHSVTVTVTVTLV